MLADAEAPLLDCISNITAVLSMGAQTAQVKWTEPTVTDNSGVYNLTSTHQSRDIFPLGESTVTYEATDEARNTANCSFTVTVIGKRLQGIQWWGKPVKRGPRALLV